MNRVVLPLSAIRFKPRYTPELLIPALLAHMVLIGPPIALAVRRFSGD